LLPQHLAHTEPNFTLLAQRIRGRGHRSSIWRGTFTDLGSRDPRVNCSAGMYLWFQCPGERSSRGNRWDACVSIPRCRRLRLPQWPSVNGPDGRSAALAFLIPGVASRPFIGSPSRFHRYFGTGSFAASEGGTCTCGLRISRPKRQTIAELASSPRVRLRSNEYSGFAVAPAHYIAFAERKHACPCQVIYHLWRLA